MSNLQLSFIFFMRGFYETEKETYLQTSFEYLSQARNCISNVIFVVFVVFSEFS